MLGLSTGLIYDGSNEPSIDSPTSVSNLIGWWDFTDASSMYTDAGSTNVSSNDDLIYRIDNKAYTKQNNTTLALGKYLEQSTEARRPVYKTSSATPISDYPFTNGDFSYGFFDVDPDGDTVLGFPDYLEGSKTIGNVATSVFSTSTHSMSNITMFFVYRSRNYASYDQYMFYMTGHDQSCTSFLCPFATKQTVSFISNSGGNSSPTDPYTELQLGSNDGPTRNKSRQWSTLDQEYTQTDFRHFQFWTIKVGDTFADYDETSDNPPYIRPGKMYKNGDESDGISNSSYSIYDDAGNNTDGGSDINTLLLNNGTSGTMEPDAIRIGSYYVPSPFTGNPEATLYPLNSMLDTELYEMIYYSKTLSDSEILGVENYIKQKYGTRVDYDSSWD